MHFSDITPNTIVYRPLPGFELDSGRCGHVPGFKSNLDYWLDTSKGTFGLLAPRQTPPPLNGSRSGSPGTACTVRRRSNAFPFVGTFHVDAGSSAAPSPKVSAYAAVARHSAAKQKVSEPKRSRRQQDEVILFQSALNDVEAVIYSLIRVAKSKLLKWQSRTRKHLNWAKRFYSRLRKRSLEKTPRVVENLAAKVSCHKLRMRSNQHN
jgi:hypothetical protein